MKILYANVIEQHAEWGSEVGVNKGLLALGDQTHCVDYRANRKRLPSIFGSFDYKNDFDAFFLHRGDRFPVDIVKTIPIPKVFWASELLSRSWDQDELLKNETFDHVWVHSLACKRKMLEENWGMPEDKIGVMTGGFDPDLFRPLNIKREYDILFIGTMSDRREAVVNELRRSGYTVEVKKRIYGEEYGREMNKAKLIVNVHMTENLDCETRLYESMATATPILTEPLSEEWKLFNINPKKGMRIFNNMDELKGLINYYLAHEKPRLKLGSSGYHEAMAKHTWGHRAKNVHDVLVKLVRKYKRKEERRKHRKAGR